MGLGSIIGNMMLFITVLVIGSLIYLFLNQYTLMTSQTLEEEKEQLLNEIQTKINITSIANESNDVCIITIYAKNVGNTIINPNKMDTYIDGLRLQKANTTYHVNQTFDIINPALWDPGEYITATINTTLLQGVHSIRIITDKGVGFTESINLENTCP